MKRKNEKDFSFDKVEISRGRERYYLENELAALQCTICKEAFPLEKFGDSKSGFAGKKSTCKPCEKTYQKERHKRWNKENSFHVLASKQNKRAESFGNKGMLTGKQVKRLYEENTNTKGLYICEVTGREILGKPHLCHAIPVDCEGGDSSLSNIYLGSPWVNVLQGKDNFFRWILDPDGGRQFSGRAGVKKVIQRMADEKGCSPEQLAKSFLTDKQVKDYCLIFNSNEEIPEFPEWKKEELGWYRVSVKKDKRKIERV